MGTLTAGVQRLPEYCDHKLPTSCRLTSIPQCCACADERAHSASYSTYIDGVGFVLRGTRWQRYCWFCREFWENRVKASGLRPAQTQIPEVPDQSEFLSRWYEFHRGFRIVQKDDGSEERVAVLGEDFRYVDPGCLPRTLEELRAGRAAAEVGRTEAQAEPVEIMETGPTLEQTLDDLFQAAENEQDSARDPETHRGESAATRTVAVHETEGNTSPSNVHAQVIVPVGSRNREYQARRVAALRRELQRMRNGIERIITGLRDLGEDVPDHAEATRRLSNLGRTLDAINGIPTREEAELTIRSVNDLASTAGSNHTDSVLANMQARIDQARQHQEDARRNREQATAELDIAEGEFRRAQQRLQQLQREQRSRENYIRLFGTREEMLAQGDQYESPIGNMFTRAYERFRAAEEVRREQRTLRLVLEDEDHANRNQDARRLAELESRERDVWGVPRPLPSPFDATRPDNEPEEAVTEQRGELEEYYALLRRQNWRQQASLPNNTQQQQPVIGADTVVEEEPDNIAQDLSSRGPLAANNGLETRRDSNSSFDSVDDSQISSAVTSRSGSGSNLAGSANVPTTEAVDDTATRDANAAANNFAVSPGEANRRWCHECLLILTHLVQNSRLTAELDLSPSAIHLLAVLVVNGTFGENDRQTLNNLRGQERLLWESGVVTQRLGQRRADGATLRLPRSEELTLANRETVLLYTELLAEAFQMSAELRRRAPGLTAPEQLRMLHRLQAGERRAEDVEKLQQMLHDRETIHLASSIHRAGENGRISISDAETEQQRRIEQELRDAARRGDHSRQELDAQRTAVRAFAVAAGRNATLAGPQALFERMARRDPATEVALGQVQDNGWRPEPGGPMRQAALRSRQLADYIFNSDSDSDSESDRPTETQGLDATDSGRPEPKTDEEMKVNMECRICYTQFAEIACLPCGHLVMCKWCSEQHSPVMARDRTRPRRAAGCPVCRKGIRQKVKIIRA